MICPAKNCVYEIEYADDVAAYCGLARCIGEGPSGQMADGRYLYPFNIIKDIRDTGGYYAEFCSEDIMREIYSELA